MNFILALAVLLAAGPSKIPYSLIINAEVMATDKGADKTGVLDATSAINSWAPSPGLSLTYEIFNNTAGAIGAIGAIAWGADFSLASAFVNPGAGLRKSINFVFDGTLWREQWRN